VGCIAQGFASQRYPSQRCHQPRVLPLLLLQPPSCYRQRRGKIAFENPIRQAEAVDVADPDQAFTRKTICFSRSIQLHDIIVGLFVNRYEFGLLV
jgi:hypothetical protein